MIDIRTLCVCDEKLNLLQFESNKVEICHPKLIKLLLLSLSLQEFYVPLLIATLSHFYIQPDLFFLYPLISISIFSSILDITRYSPRINATGT
jgi:hypothetical protein